MRTALAIAFAICFATGAVAQSLPPKHYDPYYVLPGAARCGGLDAGLVTPELGSIADRTDLFVAGKYSPNGRIEVGTRLTLGSFFKVPDPGRPGKEKAGQTLASLVVGAKMGLSEHSAATLDLLAPVGGVDDPGIAVGYMLGLEASNLHLDSHLQIGLLDGYTADNPDSTGMPSGIDIDLLVEPSKILNDRMTGYLDVLVHTNSEDVFGDYFGIDLRPYLDWKVQEGLVLSGGVSVGLTGKAKQDHKGILVTAIKTMGR